MIQKLKSLLKKSSFWEKYEKNTNLYTSNPKTTKQKRVQLDSTSPILLSFLFLWSSFHFSLNSTQMNINKSWIHTKHKISQISHDSQPNFQTNHEEELERMKKLTLVSKDLRILVIACWFASEEDGKNWEELNGREGKKIKKALQIFREF